MKLAQYLKEEKKFEVFRINQSLSSKILKWVLLCIRDFWEFELLGVAFRDFFIGGRNYNHRG